jgi:RNA polymerase sigma-70 factor (ECF subfamily)
MSDMKPCAEPSPEGLHASAALAATAMRLPVAARTGTCDAPPHGRLPASQRRDGRASAKVSGKAASEGELVAALARGDRDALGVLYDRFAPQMLGPALRLPRSRRDAEDLVHDGFLEAWQKAPSYDGSRGPVRAWLLLRVRSRAIDRVRALATAREFAMAEASSAPPPPAAPEQGSAPDRARARRALEALPPEQRAVVELAYFEGLSCRDMAERLAIPVGTIKSRLFTAMRSLRAALGAGEGE